MNSAAAAVVVEAKLAAANQNRDVCANDVVVAATRWLPPDRRTVRMGAPRTGSHTPDPHLFTDLANQLDLDNAGPYEILTWALGRKPSGAV